MGKATPRSSVSKVAPSATEPDLVASRGADKAVGAAVAEGDCPAADDVVVRGRTAESAQQRSGAIAGDDGRGCRGNS